jgi:leader peptidase (prepilin peptidase)/N-methyltransferase
MWASAAVPAAAAGVTGLLVGRALAGLTITAACPTRRVFGGGWVGGAAAGLGRRVVVTAATGAVLAAVAGRLGWRPVLPAFAVLAGTGVVLAVVDIEHRRLPDRVVVPAAGACVVLLTAAGLAHAGAELVRAVEAAAVSGGVFLVVAVVAAGGLGLGDVKLAGLLGAHLGWLGWPALGHAAALSAVLGGMTAATVLVAGRAGWRGELPYAPVLLTAALLAVLIGAAPPM